MMTSICSTELGTGKYSAIGWTRQPEFPGGSKPAMRDLHQIRLQSSHRSAAKDFKPTPHEFHVDMAYARKVLPNGGQA